MGKRLAKRQRHPLWHLTLSVILLAGAIVSILYTSWRERDDHSPLTPPVAAHPPYQVTGAKELADTLYTGIDSALVELGIRPGLISKRRQADFDRIGVGVPTDLPLAETNLAISRLVQQLGGQVLSASQRRDQVEIRCGFDQVLTTAFTLRPTAERRRTGNIAIVLDDFGGASTLAEKFCALAQPLTLSILPNQGRVDSLVDRARTNGHEVLVHLPMEPEGSEDPGDGAILMAHEDAEIRRRVRHALERVPHARGISNHMGSKATADERIMRQILSELKARNLLFLDSRTTTNSVAYQLAVDMDLMTFTRDLFIDEVDEVEAIQSRLWDLAGIASRTGQAIGIGHNREETLAALTTVLPRLETRGFRFVPVSQLLP